MQTNIRPTLRRTLVLTGLTATAGALVVAGTASAHVDPDPLAEHPAPVLLVTAEAPTDTATTDTGATAESTPAESIPAESIPAESIPAEPIATAAVDDSDEADSNTGLIIGVVAVVLVIGGVAYLVSRRGADD